MAGELNFRIEANAEAVSVVVGYGLSQVAVDFKPDHNLTPADVEAACLVLKEAIRRGR
ncbi:MAG: hypothetical protein WC807_18725 [Hyphomicrobium sp.]|jgi:hypothetical protein